MAGEQTITVIGRLTNDPELRFTPSGHAVANFTIAQNARTFDRQANEWKDGPTTFWRCDVWRDMAENVAESLTKGAGVVAYGRLETRTYETKEGEKRSVIELHVDNIGPDLRWGTAKLVKAHHGNSSGFAGNQGQQGNGGGWGGNQPATQHAGGDPWAQQANTGWASPDDSGVPF